MNQYRTISTPTGEISFSRYFWEVSRAGTAIKIAPRKLLPKETYESVCKKTLKNIQSRHKLVAINRQGIKPYILVYQAALIPIEVDVKINC